MVVVLKTDEQNKTNTEISLLTILSNYDVHLLCQTTKLKPMIKNSAKHDTLIGPFQHYTKMSDTYLPQKWNRFDTWHKFASDKAQNLL